MKVGIITLYHNNKNYGAVLQAYAMTEFINSIKKGTAIQIAYDLKAHRYLPNRFFYIKDKKCEKFRNSVPHTETYVKENILDKIRNEFDAIIIGGDQVWNPNKEGTYERLLPSVNTRKISYAASIAVTKLTPQQSVMLPLIGCFDYIGIREESGKKLLLENNLKKDITVVVDPVVLISLEKWREMAVYPIKNRNYSYCCFLGNNKYFRDLTTKITHTCKLPLVNIPYIGTSFNNFDEFFADYKFEQAGPEEFLGLIDGSKLVFTDSFHCTLFSIIFKRNFFVFLKDSNNPNISTNARITDLLKDLGLSHRIINSEKDITQELLNEKIDYDKVFVILNEKLQISLDFLRNAFKGTELEEGLNNLDFTIN